jgi:hypothetical protein
VLPHKRVAADAAALQVRRLLLRLLRLAPLLGQQGLQQRRRCRVQLRHQ